MAININLAPRGDVDPYSQPISRSFIGFDPKLSDEQLWNANRGVYALPEGAEDEQFATLSFEGTIRLVAELEGNEGVDLEDGRQYALMGRLLHRGDPVRDALVGQPVEDEGSVVTLIDTTEQDEMTAAERYAATERASRTFLITHNVEKWFWTPEDLQDLINRTHAGATVRECWPTGGRRHGIEPGDRVFLLERENGRPRGVRGCGRVSSRIYSGEHWDDTNRTSNYVDIDWDLMLESEESIMVDQLQREVPGYAWNPQKSGVELHQPMADEMERAWERHVGDDAPPLLEQQPTGWDFDDNRRRVTATEARARLQVKYKADGWEVAETNEDRPFCAVAFRDDETIYLFAKGAETVGRPVLLTAEEVEHARENPGSCVLGVLSDLEFDQGTITDEMPGILTVVPLEVDEEHLVPVLYRLEEPAENVETIEVVEGAVEPTEAQEG